MGKSRWRRVNGEDRQEGRPAADHNNLKIILYSIMVLSLMVQLSDEAGA